jgi:murein DD-endopeptidase MepM/ murein hydrolase activator NlpD
MKISHYKLKKIIQEEIENILTKPEDESELGPVRPVGTYIVKKNDILSAIALAHGIRDWRILWKANPQITNPHLIEIGQKINIPNKEEIKKIATKVLKTKDRKRQKMQDGSSSGKLIYPVDTSARHCIGHRWGLIHCRWCKNKAKTRRHAGLDMSGAEGDNIYACHDGVVSNAGWGLKRGGGKYYGNVIVLQSLDGSYFTLYSHLSKMNVKEDQKVATGDVIGHVGQTGNTKVPHLHFELRVGSNNRGSSADPVPHFSTFPSCSGGGPYAYNNPRIGSF